MTYWEKWLKETLLVSNENLSRLLLSQTNFQNTASASQTPSFSHVICFYHARINVAISASDSFTISPRCESPWATWTRLSNWNCKQYACGSTIMEFRGSSSASSSINHVYFGTPGLHKPFVSERLAVINAGSGFYHRQRLQQRQLKNRLKSKPTGLAFKSRMASFSNSPMTVVAGFSV